MKIFVNGELVTGSSQDSIVLVFDNDEERLSVANHLANFEPKDGPREYGIFPDTLSLDTRYFLMNWASNACRPGGMGHSTHVGGYITSESGDVVCVKNDPDEYDRLWKKYHQSSEIPGDLKI